MNYELLDIGGQLFVVEPCCCGTKRTLTPVRIDDAAEILAE